MIRDRKRFSRHCRFRDRKDWTVLSGHAYPRLLKAMGIFIILMFLLAPVSAGECLIYDPTVEYVNNGGEVEVNNNVAFNLKCANNADAMSFTEIMHYLLVGNVPDYVIVHIPEDGDITKATFTVTVFADKDNYHNINDNFETMEFGNDDQEYGIIGNGTLPSPVNPNNSAKITSLNDTILVGTLFYTEEDDYSLKTKFVTNDDTKLDLVNFAILKQSIRNTQYVVPPKVSVELPCVADKDEIYKLIDEDPIDGSMEVLYFVNEVITEFEKAMVQYASEQAKIYGHNQVISKARSDQTATKYWGSGYWPQLKDIDDNGLLFINVNYQALKGPLKDTEYKMQEVVLCMEEGLLAMESLKIAADAATCLAPDWMKTAFNFVYSAIMNGIKWSKWHLDNTRLKKITNKFIEADKMTWAISGEKDYRELVRKGAINPPQPSKSELEEYNDLLRQKAAFVNNTVELERSRIFDNSNDTELYNTYMDTYKYILDQLQAYYDLNQTPPDYIQKYHDSIEGFMSNIDNIHWLNEQEQVFWQTYLTMMDAQHKAILMDLVDL